MNHFYHNINENELLLIAHDLDKQGDEWIDSIKRDIYTINYDIKIHRII